MPLHSVDIQAGVSPAPAQPEGLPPYHAQSMEDCLRCLVTSLQGLSDADVDQRRKTSVHKPIDALTFKTPPQIFLGSVKKYTSLLFVASAGLSFSMQHWTDGALILLAMLVNVGIQGVIQWKSQIRQKALPCDSAIRCQVRRNGQTLTVNSDELVVGDILVISGGQLMPADARLLSSYQMQADESLLTGESVLVPKNANALPRPMEDVTAQANMLFAGTVVKTGKGEAVVTALGTHTVMGKIASIASKTRRRESPFTRRINRLSFKIFFVALALIGVVAAAGAGIYRNIPLPQLIQVALVMGIAAFPETISSLAGLILSLGVNRLSDKKVLVKSFQAIETIGDITVVCTDKTGTLTENYLNVDQLFLPGMGAVPYNPKWQLGQDFPSCSVEALLRVGRLNNGTVLEGLRSPLMGDPIDVAIYRAAPATLETGYHARLTIPFDPVTLRSATLCETSSRQTGSQTVSMIKGAPESVLEICKYFMMPNGSLSEISLTQRSEFLMFNRKLAYENNLRVIGFAQKTMVEDDPTGPYSNAVFLGWVCLLDPAKPGVLQAIEQLQQTGARVVMITGDQKATAEITARELGIMRRNADEAWLRSDLEVWEEPSIPNTVQVFARTKPEEKLAIVEILQQSGQVVAMVGDGVNDSPALQKSDVAIAMGLQGSEAAKESADIILMNDRLEGIMQAMTESRILRHKVHSCIRYLLSCNLGLLLFVTAAALAGQGLPLNVIEILWLNLVVVSIPALVLAIEPPRPEDFALPGAADASAEVSPRAFKRGQSKPLRHTDPKADPLNADHLFLMAYWSVLMMLAGLTAYFTFTLGLKQPPAVAGTAAFCALAFAQTFNLFNVQAMNAGENRRQVVAELASTPITWIVIAITLVLQVLTIYVPGVNTLLGTAAIPLPLAAIPVALGMGAILFSLKTMKL